MIFSIILNSIALIVLLAHNKMTMKDFFRPFSLFAFSLIATLLISSLKLSTLQHNFSLYFLGLIYCALFFFWVGTRLKTGAYAHTRKRYSINPSRYNIAVNALFLSIAASFAITVYILGAPPLVSGADRVSYYVPGIESILMLSYLLVYMIVYDRFTNRYINTYKATIFFTVILLILFSKMNKMSLFFVAFELLFLFHFLKKKISSKQVFLFGILTISAFILAYIYTYSDYYNIDVEARILANGFKLNGSFGYLVDPYMYIVCNFENLQNYLLNSTHTHSYGYGMVSPFLELFNAGDTLRLGTTVKTTWTDSLQYPWLTTGTIFRDIFHDFSYLGFIIVPLVLGAIGQSAYDSFNKYRDIFSGLIYVVISFSLTLAFFTNILWQKIYLVNILVGCIVIFYVRHQDAAINKKLKVKTLKKQAQL